MTSLGALRPAPAGESEIVLAELVENFLDRLQNGEILDSRAFAAEHPEHAQALLSLLPAASAMAELRRSALRHASPIVRACLDSDAIGDYRIVREIGRGGMGVVYEAEQVSIGRKVALKVLPISSATDPKQIERFRIEGRAAAALDHPHIVPVYEIGSERRVHFYAMQFVDGCSLAALVHEARSGTTASILGPREAARLALQAAEALDHAHGLGILHRDIKPANLLLDSTGHLWVADFGLARFLDGGDLTQTGDVIGTLRYLSPEQARGRRTLGPRTDIYSLGATLYELTTLQPAFDGHDRQELLRRIAADEPIAPRRLDPAIPRDLETIISTAMAKEVGDRYGSASEFADDLRRFLDGRPIVAQRPGAPKRAARWAWRNKAGVSIALVVLALFLVGLGVGVGLLWREQVRTRENLRVALTALDEFCLSTTGMELTRSPEQTQDFQNLQLKALTIYERMLSQNPGDPDARWAAARAEHRVANILARSPRFAEAEPAYLAAHQHLELLLSGDPGRLEYRQEAADILGDWGASQPVGKPETRDHRRRAMSEHLRLFRRYPGREDYRRALSRDCIEVARTIGITDPAEALEKEALFRRAVQIRQIRADRSFDSQAEFAEALAYLGHLLNATRRTSEGSEVMARGKALLTTLGSVAEGDPIRRHRILTLEQLFGLPRYCDPAPNPDEVLQVRQSVLEGQARLVAEFPFLPEFRAQLAWGHFVQGTAFRSFGRVVEAEASMRRSLGMFEELLRGHRSVDHYRKWAVIAFENLGDLLEASDRDQEAKEPFRRAFELVPEGANHDPASPGNSGPPVLETPDKAPDGSTLTVLLLVSDRSSALPERPGRIRPECRRGSAVFVDRPRIVRPAGFLVQNREVS